MTAITAGAPVRIYILNGEEYIFLAEDYEEYSMELTDQLIAIARGLA